MALGTKARLPNPETVRNYGENGTSEHWITLLGLKLLTGLSKYTNHYSWGARTITFRFLDVALFIICIRDLNLAKPIFDLRERKHHGKRII
jgi:hypothetical protein